MTCIVGLKDKENKCVWIGGDACATSGYNITQSSPKVREKNGVVVGGGGDWKFVDKAMNLIFQFLETESFNLDAIELYLIENLKKYKIQETEQLSIMLLLAHQDKLYWSTDNIHFSEVFEEYSAIGVGENVARGALFVSQQFIKDKPTKWHVELALEASRLQMEGISKPYTILSTLPKEKPTKRPKIELVQ